MPLSSKFHPKASLSILCWNQVEVTRRCIDSICRYTNLEEVEIIITDNGSTDETPIFLSDLQIPHLKVITREKNIGFVRGHNEVAKIFEGDYLIILNNDILACPQWLEKTLDEFERDPLLAQVGGGIDACYTLGPDGLGFKGKNIDFIEASFMAIPRWAVEHFGLFDEDFEIGYCEDADLSLRIQEAGYRIKHLNIPLRHSRFETSGKSSLDITGILLKNRNHLLQKWNYYFKHRHFHYPIAIKRSEAYGDVFLITPLLPEIKKKWPLSKITILTKCPEVLRNNPFIDSVIHPSAKYKKEDFFKFYDLDKGYEKQPFKHIVDAYSEICEVNPADKMPKIYLNDNSKKEKNLLSKDKWIAIHTSKSWPNRTWPLPKWAELVSKLKNLKFKVVEIGNSSSLHIYNVDLSLRGKLSVNGTAHLLKSCKAFIGIDSFPSHLAQALGIPSVILFGCIHPNLRLHRGGIDKNGNAILNKIMPVWNSSLGCKGCHHWLPSPRDYSECTRSDKKNLCMISIEVDQVLETVIQVMREGEREKKIEILFPGREEELIQNQVNGTLPFKNSILSYFYFKITKNVPNFEFIVREALRVSKPGSSLVFETPNSRIVYSSDDLLRGVGIETIKKSISIIS